MFTQLLNKTELPQLTPGEQWDCSLFRAAIQQNWTLFASLNHYFLLCIPVKLLWNHLYFINHYLN